MRKYSYLLVGLGLLVIFPLCMAEAQLGLDMVNNEMIEAGLFRPHKNNCSSSEAFVTVGQTAGSSALGFCIEIDERNGSGLDWEDSRQVCAALGNRLPEPAEFKIACDDASALGLNNMSDDWEIVSNFPYMNAPQEHLDTTVMGNGSCYKAAPLTWANGQGSAGSLGFNFRCVH